MAIAIPKAFQTMRNDNEIHTAKTYQEKMRYMQEVQERERRAQLMQRPYKNQFEIDPYYLEEKEEAYRLQQELQNRKEAEEHARLRCEFMDSPAMQCTVTDGVNLWIAKFGDGWIDRHTLQQGGEGMDWSVLTDRLRKINMMEEMDTFVRIRT